MIRRLLAHRRYMREHRWTHAHLSGYLDSELSADATERVKEHTGVCPECHRVLATLRRTLAGLRQLGLGPEPAPAGVADTIIGRLRREA